MPPDQGLADKNSSGVKGSKVQLTYLLTSNADGSEKLPPLIIGKAKKPRAFQNKTGAQLGFHYKNNVKAWMTADLYQEWLRQWDRELGARERKIVLLQDNFSGHIVPDGLQNILIVNFEPNLTAHVQPMDQGIIRCFKAHYHSKYIQCTINCYDAGTTPSEVYNINQLQAMRLADLAWREVDATTIRHCWHKAGILPTMYYPGPAQPAVPISSLLHANPHDLDPITTAEDELRLALDDLEATGILQSKNRMGIEALLNPPEESQMMEAMTDEEICQTVLAAHKAQEEGPISGGDDDVEDDTLVEPCPTYHEMFRAASIMNKFAGHVDDPDARKFEAALASFTRTMRSKRSQTLTTTHITDYF
jgi:hypothetical protein